MNVEYLSTNQFLKDVVAFANSSGGKLIIEIGGMNPFRLSDSITDRITSACTPVIDVDITPKSIESKTVLEIYVPAGKYRPYFIQSLGKEHSTYVRINGISRLADPWKLKELEMEGQHIYYDMLPEIGMEFDLNEAKSLCQKMYQVALGECNTSEERTQVREISIIHLENMGILQKSGNEYIPTHAYRLLTCNGIRHAKVQCALFKGVERDVFIDRKEFTGPIYEQINEAYQFLCRHTNLKTEFVGLQRRDIYELPVLAVREAIINAVAHRSYLDDSCIQLSIYDDRVEVYSPGCLYGGLNIKDALTGKSKCRNAAIAEALHYMKFMETWGTGLTRIQTSCKEYGLKQPCIEEFGNGFKVTFFRRIVSSNFKVRETNVNVQYANISFQPLIDAGIKESRISEIKQLYSEYHSTHFQRSDIVETLKCKNTKASEIISLLKAYNLIVSVSGYGKGRYCFYGYQK